MGNQSVILVVDDKPVNLEIMADLLFDPSYKLAFAKNGQEAITKTEQLKPDLVLLDVMMPGMDGFEVCERIRANPELAEIPIIMVTALDDQESRLRGIRVGADDFVSKPFNRTELQARVRTITRLNRYRRLLGARAKFQWVVERAEVGYVILDENAVVLFANAKARHYLNLPLDIEQPLSENFVELCKRQYTFVPDTDILEDNGEWTVETETSYHLVRPESAASPAFWLRLYVFAMPESGDKRWLVSLHDVTRDRTLERDMQTFHAMISHKLRTPLSGIVSGLDLLLSSQQDLAPQDAAYIVKMARDGGLRLHGEIEDIIEYLEATAGPVQPENRLALSDLASLIETVRTGLELQDVTLSMPDEVKGLCLSLSSHSVEVILWEVLENAKKFHPDQRPKVEIRVFESKPEYVTIQISDDGQGLSPEQLAQIWVPYYQAERYFTGEVPGMGLGLSRVAAFVWEVGGVCHARNRESGHGIVIAFEIPCLTDCD